jgi:hypothetical protein
MNLRFEWDAHKALTNQVKHGLSFEEAMSVFTDPLARIFDDSDHSIAESREIIVGLSQKQRLLAPIIHERFCCNRGFAAATSLDAVGPASRQAGSPLSRSTSCSRIPPSLAGSALEPASPTLTRGPAPL